MLFLAHLGAGGAALPAAETLRQIGLRKEFDFSLPQGLAEPWLKRATRRRNMNQPLPGIVCTQLFWRIQRVDATDSLNISAGVWKPSVLRGLSFNCLAIASS